MTRAASACLPEVHGSSRPCRCAPWRVRDARAFAALRASRRRARCGPLWIAWVPGRSDEPAKVAFSISRRVGKAVTRNRLRRQLRTLLAQLRLAPGSYLVGAGPEAAALSFNELKALVSKALDTLDGSDNP